MLAQFRARLKGLVRPTPPSRPPSPAASQLDSLTDELTRAGISLADWIDRVRTERRFYVDLPITVVERLRLGQPNQVGAVQLAAEQILDHQFNLLGSGPYVPLDPDRPAAANGYRPIDWYLDPVSGLRFPQGIHYQQWDLYKMRPGQADVKLPWELARCQHWVTLGQAYRLTGEDRYAKEMVHQLSDFAEGNPVGLGIHWTCTMDVALRALNWALGLTLIRDCATLPSDFWPRAYAALFAHGLFISSNLEDKYEVTSNHFLSTVVGLFFLANFFRDLPQGGVWNRFCRESLEREMTVQVLEDGADFESSIPYHRLVTELFLSAARQAEHQGEPLSAGYLDRLRAMVSFLVDVTRPDGLMPQVGDADDGRVHIFTDYSNWQRQDARHLLAPAALLLKEPAWLPLAGPSGASEAAWWGFEQLLSGNEAQSAERQSAQPAREQTGEQKEAGLMSAGSPVELPPCYRLFPQAGLAVMRENGNYLLVTNGVVGTKGFGNHKHNDQLGFEYHAAGKPLLVDPGSYVYTADFAARNLFRSTAYHNTLSIDGIEQNELRPEWIFRLFETAHAEHVAYEVADAYAEYRGRHLGFRRLPQAVTHERTLRLSRDTGTLLISDRLVGSGQHQLTWHFHGAPGVFMSRITADTYLLRNGEASFRLKVPAGLDGQISAAWYSPSYGVRMPCMALDLSLNLELNDEQCWSFLVEPEAAAAEDLCE